MDTRLGAREIPIISPWWSAFTEFGRVESQQEASRLAGCDGTLLPYLGPVMADSIGLVSRIMPSEIFSQIDNNILFPAS